MKIIRLLYYTALGFLLSAVTLYSSIAKFTPSLINWKKRVLEETQRSVEQRKKEIFKSLTRVKIYISVLQQKGDDCGFHAVKNALLMAQGLMENKSANDMEVYLNSAQTSKIIEDWREYLITHNLPSTALSCLEVVTLTKNYLAASDLHKKLLTDRYNIIDSIIDIKPVTVYPAQSDTVNLLCKNWINALDSLIHDERTTQAFIIGDKTHWIGVVAHKTPREITYYSMDSLNRGRVPKNEAMVDALIKFIDETDLETLKLVIKARPSSIFTELMENS